MTEDKDEKLSQLIIAIIDAPLPWGEQQKLVDLFMELMERIGREHKEHVERLECITKNQFATIALLKNLKGCHLYVDYLRRCRQGRQDRACKQAKRKT